MSARAEPEKDAAAAACEEDEETEAAGGELLYCGGTCFDTMGRKVAGGPQGNLVSPTRLRPLVGVDIRFVASGYSESCRPYPSVVLMIMCVCWSMAGRLFSRSCFEILNLVDVRDAIKQVARRVSLPLVWS
jgi:hypothetical protein